MIPILVDGPAVEPVTLAEMRAHLRLDDGAEDDLVAALLRAARLTVETASGRVLIESRWRVRLRGRLLASALRLPLSPLIAVEEVSLVSRDGGTIALAPDRYEVQSGEDRPAIELGPLAPLPRSGERLEILFRAGYGAAPSSVPPPLVQAVRVLAAHWFENRGDAPPGPGLPPEVGALVAPYRPARL